MYALIQHEWRLTGRPLLLAWLAFVAIELSLLVPFAMNVPILRNAGLTFAIMLIPAFVAGVGGYLVVHYYRTMCGQQAYFTHSLPILGRRIYWVKIGHAVAVLCAALLTATAAAWCLYAAEELSAHREVFSPTQLLILVYRDTSPGMFWFFATSIVLGFINLVVSTAFALSVGSQSRLQTFGLGGPVLVGVATYFVQQFLTLLAFLVVPIGLKLVVSPDGRMVGSRLVFESMLPALVEQFTTGYTASPVVGLGSVLMVGIVIVVLVGWTIKSIEKHTSLR